MDELPKLEFVSWSEFQQHGFELAGQLLELKLEIDTMVSVSRGGHVLSRILSDFLNLPIFSVSIQSYKTIEMQGELVITQELGVDLSGKHVLLVDEIVDSGKTLKRAVEHVVEWKAEAVTTVAMHVKPKAIMQADFFANETSNWVVYPYEVRETVNALMPMWEKVGKPITSLVDELVAGGMKREHVEFCMNGGK